MFNYNKLLGRIREVCGTHEEFAKEMHMGRVSLSQRLNNKQDFNVKEIDRACKVLGISKEEIVEYFFCKISSETRTKKENKK